MVLKHAASSFVEVVWEQTVSGTKNHDLVLVLDLVRRLLPVQIQVQLDLDLDLDLDSNQVV